MSSLDRGRQRIHWRAAVLAAECGPALAALLDRPAWQHEFGGRESAAGGFVVTAKTGAGAMTDQKFKPPGSPRMGLGRATHSCPSPCTCRA